MIRSTLTALLLLLPLTAEAQATRPAHPPVSELVAQAVQKLRAAKQLQRLLGPSHFQMQRKSGTYRFRLQGVEQGGKLRLTGELHKSTRPSFVEYVYVLGAKGLERFRLHAVRVLPGGVTRQGYAADVRGDKLLVRRFEDGKLHDPPVQVTWSTGALPTQFARFVLPALFDQGLPSALELSVMTEEKVSPQTKPDPVRLERSATPSQGTHAWTLTRRNRAPSLIRVRAEEPGLGRIERVQIDPSRTFTRIDAKAYAGLKRDAERAQQERAAGQFLRGLHYTQRVYRRNKGAFAATFDEIKGLDRRFPARLAGIAKTHEILLRAAPDKTKWMAIARPKAEGARHLVVNQAGKIHASEKPLALDDGCAIPAGATPLR